LKQTSIILRRDVCLCVESLVEELSQRSDSIRSMLTVDVRDWDAPMAQGVGGAAIADSIQSLAAGVSALEAELAAADRRRASEQLLKASMQQAIAELRTLYAETIARSDATGVSAWTSTANAQSLAEQSLLFLMSVCDARFDTMGSTVSKIERLRQEYAPGDASDALLLVLSSAFNAMSTTSADAAATTIKLALEQNDALEARLASELQLLLSRTRACVVDFASVVTRSSRDRESMVGVAESNKQCLRTVSRLTSRDYMRMTLLITVVWCCCWPRILKTCEAQANVWNLNGVYSVTSAMHSASRALRAATFATDHTVVPQSFLPPTGREADAIAIDEVSRLIQLAHSQVVSLRDAIASEVTTMSHSRASSAHCPRPDSSRSDEASVRLKALVTAKRAEDTLRAHGITLGSPTATTLTPRYSSAIVDHSERLALVSKAKQRLSRVNREVSAATRGAQLQAVDEELESIALDAKALTTAIEVAPFR
jgi:hypothetical protein